MAAWAVDHCMHCSGQLSASQTSGIYHPLHQMEVDIFPLAMATRLCPGPSSNVYQAFVPFPMSGLQVNPDLDLSIRAYLNDEPYLCIQ